MTNFSPMKPREPGSIWDAIASAVSQIGGADRFAHAVDRKPHWTYAVSDADQSAKQRVQLSYADACRLSEKGATALAEHMALCAGGVFLPVQMKSAEAIHASAASLSRETGEALATIFQGAADGTWDAADRRAALPQLLDVIEALAPLIAQCREEPA